MEIRELLQKVLNDLRVDLEAIRSKREIDPLGGKVNANALQVDVEGALSEAMIPVYEDPLDNSTRTGRRDVMIWSGVTMVVALLPKLPTEISAVGLKDLTGGVLIVSLLAVQFYHLRSFYVMAKRNRRANKHRIDAIGACLSSYEKDFSQLKADSEALLNGLRGTISVNNVVEKMLAEISDASERIRKLIADALSDIDLSMLVARRHYFITPMALLMLSVILLFLSRLAPQVIQPIVNLTGDVMAGSGKLTSSEAEATTEVVGSDEVARCAGVFGVTIKDSTRICPQHVDEPAEVKLVGEPVIHMRSDSPKDDDENRACEIERGQFCACWRDPYNRYIETVCRPELKDCQRFERRNRRRITHSCEWVPSDPQALFQSLPWRPSEAEKCPALQVPGFCIFRQ